MVELLSFFPSPGARSLRGLNSDHKPSLQEMAITHPGTKNGGTAALEALPSVHWTSGSRADWIHESMLDESQSFSQDPNADLPSRPGAWLKTREFRDQD